MLAAARLGRRQDSVFLVGRDKVGRRQGKTLGAGFEKKAALPFGAFF